MSDAELLHYKFPDKEVTLRDVTRIRRSAVERTQNWLMFHRVVSVILQTYDESTGLIYCPGRSKLLDTVLASKPLCLDVFQFQPWMLTLLIDPDYPKLVVPSFSFRDTLLLSQKDYDILCKDIRVMRSGDSLFETIV